MTSLRRERLATSAHEMPVLYLVVVVAAGLALVVNAAALAVDRHHRVAWLTAGLVVVVALVVALLLAITSPFRGGFIADGTPIDVVTVDLEDGFFSPLSGATAARGAAALSCRATLGGHGTSMLGPG